MSNSGFNLREITPILPNHTMAYQQISVGARELPHILSDTIWSGNGDAALDRLTPIVDGASLETDFWAPANIVRLVVDNARGDGRIELLTKATRLAMCLYAGTPGKEAFEDLHAGIYNTDLQKSVVCQAPNILNTTPQ